MFKHINYRNYSMSLKAEGMFFFIIWEKTFKVIWESEEVIGQKKSLNMEVKTKFFPWSYNFGCMEDYFNCQSLPCLTTASWIQYASQTLFRLQEEKAISRLTSRIFLWAETSDVVSDQWTDRRCRKRRQWEQRWVSN